MSDEVTLADLAEDLTKDLPIGARKVIAKALEHGWKLNPPGMTVALRLNHPTDELAAPVYVTWVVKRTPGGKVGFAFSGSSTAALVPLKGPDLLTYLEDPTTAYTLAEELQEAAQDRRDNPPWSDRLTVEENLRKQLGAEVIQIIPDVKEGKRRTFEQVMEENARKREERASSTAARATPSEPSGQASPQPSQASRLRVSL